MYYLLTYLPLVHVAGCQLECVLTMVSISGCKCVMACFYQCAYHNIIHLSHDVSFSNMLDRYVNDEFRAEDRDFSNSKAAC